MTINLSDNSPRISYSVADGVTQTSFTVPFEFFDDDDLNVYVDGTLKTLTTDYTTTGGDGSTGTVVISVTGASGGSTVVITRDIDIERTTDFPTSGPFQIAALNTELDRITAIAADLDDRAARALQLTDYDAAAGLTLPVVDDRKGKTLAFNAVTGAVEAGPSTADVQSVSDTAADIALLADIQDGTVATNAITNVNTIRTDVTTVSGISSDVTTVANNDANVTTVATNDANITTVATNIASVNTVATNIADVITVANDLNEAVSEVVTVADDLNEAISEIDTVATSITNVDLVGGSIANVNTVATDLSGSNTIGTVSANITNVNAVGGISSDVTVVAGISSDVTTVAADGTDIGTVAGISANVTTVAGVSSNVTTVAGISANVTTVAGISANVTTVAGDTANIGTIATNLNGTDTIGTVAGSISNVNSVGGAISDVTTVASNLTDVQSFANTYRIGTTDPTTSLDTGDLFFNTSSGVLKVYTGSAWEAGVTAGSGFLPLTGGTLTGDLSFGDNDKAIFGAGSDLQIYHDGSNSYIRESGVGNLLVQAQNLELQSVSGEKFIRAVDNAEVNLYFNESAHPDPKLKTTVSGVDITGTLTSDGLTVDGGAISAGDFTGTAAGGIRISGNGTTLGTSSFDLIQNSSGSLILARNNETLHLGTNNVTDRLSIAGNGDISFYEDTGTTAKFFWDASAESLGIGTSSPEADLHIKQSGADKNGIKIERTDNTAEYLLLSNHNGASRIYGVDENGVGRSTIQFGGSEDGSTFNEHMRIDSSGNVGIGTASPNNYSANHKSITLNAPTTPIIDLEVNGTRTGSIVAESTKFDFNAVTSVPVRFLTADTERMRIDSSGNLLVGTTTSPSGSGKLALAKGVVENTTTVSYASSIALTYDNGSIQTVTLTGNVTFTDSLADGEAIVLMLNGGASYTVTWTAVTKWVSSSGNAAPTLTANDTIVLWKIGSTVYAAYAGSYT